MIGRSEPRRPSPPGGIPGRLGRWVELTVPTMVELREKRPVVPPLLLGWVLSLLATWTLAPLVETALAEQLDGPAGFVQGWMWLLAALAPVVQSGQALLWATVAWALLTLASREGSFRSLFSVFLYGEVLVAAHGVLLALYFQWTQAPGTANRSFVDPLSLAAIVPSNHGFWAGLVEHLAVVDVVWTGFVAVAGLRVLGLARGEAWVLALALWFGSVAVTTTRLLLNG